MSIQNQNNYFNSLPNKAVANIISFLPKKDGMKLGLTSTRLYAVAKETLIHNITQEQDYIKKEIKSNFQVFVDIEKGPNFDPSKLVKTMNTIELTSEKMRAFLDNKKILAYLNEKNGLLSIDDMIEIQFLTAIPAEGFLGGK